MAGRSKRRGLLLSVGAAALAGTLVLGIPLSASAATAYTWWDGNTTKGNWYGSGDSSSVKITVVGRTSAITTVQARVNRTNVTTGTGGAVVMTFARKSNPDFDCRWTRPLTGSAALPLMCTSYK